MLRHHILVIGDRQIGKSSFCLQLVENKFTKTYICTIFPEQYHLKIKKHLLVFYDTPGNERFHIGLEPKYIKSDIAILFVNEESEIEEWFQRVKRWAPLISWIVVANTSSNKGKEWANKHNIPFNVINVQTKEGFDDVIQQILNLTQFHASRSTGLSLRTQDEEYHHYCT